MAAAAIGLRCARGEAVTFPLTHQTSESNTTPKDITGWTIAGTAKDENGNIVFSLAGAVVSGPAGTYTLSVTHAQTLVEPKSYRLDVWRTDGSSETLMGIGTITIDQNVLYGV